MPIYNAAQYKKIMTSKITTANGTQWSNMNSQQTPHVPPFGASHGMSTMGNLEKLLRPIEICLYFSSFF